MIQDELKTYRLESKLQKQLEHYKKCKEQKLLLNDMHKIQKFRQKQVQLERTKFDEYLKQKQKKQSTISRVNAAKLQQNEKIKFQNSRKMNCVRKRFIDLQRQDTKNRLSRAISSMSQKTVKSKHKNSNSRIRLLQSPSKERSFFQRSTEDCEEEQKRITSYLKKMKNAESKILLKQLKYEEKKQKNIKSQVKNLIKERDQKEQNQMKSLQQNFIQRMGSFFDNLKKFQMQNASSLMARSQIKQKFRQRVIKNKEFNNAQQINKMFNSFMRKQNQKQNIYKKNQIKIDLIRAKSSFLNNTIKICREKLEKENDLNIRLLYEKLNKIKRLKPSESLEEKEKQMLISLLDNQDPSYAQMVDFINHSKNQFLKIKLSKEQQKAKLQKLKKAARFNNKN